MTSPETLNHRKSEFTRELKDLKNEIFNSNAVDEKLSDDLDRILKDGFRESRRQEQEKQYEEYKKSIRAFVDAWMPKLNPEKKEKFLEDLGGLLKSCDEFLSASIDENLLLEKYNEFLNNRVGEFEGEEAKAFMHDLRDKLGYDMKLKIWEKRINTPH